MDDALAQKQIQLVMEEMEALMEHGDLGRQLELDGAQRGDEQELQL